MKEIKSILFAAALSASFIADEAIAQPTLVDPIEVFEGSSLTIQKTPKLRFTGMSPT